MLMIGILACDPDFDNKAADAFLLIGEILIVLTSIISVVWGIVKMCLEC